MYVLKIIKCQKLTSYSTVSLYFLDFNVVELMTNQKGQERTWSFDHYSDSHFRVTSATYKSNDYFILLESDLS